MVGLEEVNQAGAEVLASSAGAGGSGGCGSCGNGSSASTAPTHPDTGQHALAWQLQASLRALMQAYARFQRSTPVEGFSAFELMKATLQPMLEPAGRVAALVEAYHQQPEQRAAAAVELAQAVATRSCANLRCPNVAGQGREAEGRPNQRCSACRAVHYCCRECNVVDWKAGHRRMCSVLAAAAAASASAAEAGASAPQS